MLCEAPCLSAVIAERIQQETDTLSVRRILVAVRDPSSTTAQSRRVTVNIWHASVHAHWRFRFRVPGRTPDEDANRAAQYVRTWYEKWGAEG